MAKITWPPLEEKIRFSLPKKGPYEVEVNPDYGLIIYFVDDHAKSGIGLSWTKIFEMFGVGP